MRYATGFVLLGLGLALATPTLAASPRAGTPGSVLATEDTLHTEVPPVLVHAARVTLDEILDRVARGEARRDSAMQDQSFLATVRMIGHSDEAAPRVLLERVARVYRKRPGRVRTVPLRERDDRPKAMRDDGPGAGASMNEDIVDFAFDPAARARYRYRIAAREVVGDRVVYRLAFEPRSTLDPGQPSGLVWVDTRDFVIVRQELTFRESPVPLFMKGIRRMVIERRRVDEHWMLARVLIRIESAFPFPGLGRMFDFAIAHDDITVNTGLPDSLFVGTGVTR